MRLGVVHPTLPEPQDQEIKMCHDEKKSPKKIQIMNFMLPVVIFLVFLLAMPAFLLSVRNRMFYKSVVTDIPKCIFGCNKTFEKPPLLLISFDGFRTDYLNLNLTPTLKHLFECGVTTPYLISSFPSITFPNHYSIVTGLFPGYHGIIDNTLFGVDSRNPGERSPLSDKKQFAINDLKGEWYGGEPIWNTVSKAGGKSAVSYWPGSEVLINGRAPDFWQKYNSSKNVYVRIEEIIDYLKLPSPQRPDFYTFYYNNPDESGHKYGPDSTEVNKTLEYVDTLTNYILKRLDEEGMLGCINIVIVSDHGMEALKQSPEFHAKLADVIGTYPYNATAVTSTVGHVYVEQEEVSPGRSLLDTFNVCRGGHPFAAWTRQNIPRRYHYTNNRVGSLVFESEPGSKFFKDELKLRKGDHGYDPLSPHMRAIFGAFGPSLKKGVTTEPFQNIELYNLFVELLQLPNRAKNNGTIGRLNDFLVEPAPKYKFPPAIKPCNLQANTECFKSNPISLLSLNSAFCVSYNYRCEISLFNQALRTSEGKASAVTKTFLVSSTRPFHPELTLSSFRTAHGKLIRQSKAYKNIQIFIENLAKTEQSTVFMGVITDSNNNGIADDADDTTQLTHFFIVIQKCINWNQSGNAFCENAKSAKFLPFIFPIEKKDHNCLKYKNYLYRHTVRLRDIELLTGFDFNADVFIKTRVIVAL